MNVRPVTCKLLEMADEGLITFQQIAEAALNHMSEDDVEDMARCNELLPDYDEHEDDGEDPENDGQPDEAQEWHDFDPDC